MNAVVALCHFCEQHGPSIMFCSEKSGESPDSEDKIEVLPELSTSMDVSSSLGTSYQELCDSDLSRSSSRQGSTKSSLCQACQSLPDEHRGFISYDSQAADVFVSSQHPQNPDVFSKVRQACVRSLSCEVCPGREGPIFYGDENNGYILSYTFYIKDSQARGLKRWYSIIVVMMDRIHLIQSWPFLVESIEKIIAHLQKSALSIYEADHSCKQTHTSTVTPRNFRANRSSKSNARALAELIGDPKLYSYFHAAFVWMMRACKLRWKENISCVSSVLENLSINSPEAEPNEEFYDRSVYPEKFNIVFTSLRHMRELLQPPLFRVVAWHLLVGHQVIWHGPRSVVSSAIRVLGSILPGGCANVLEWSDSYVKDVNLLGLSHKATLPKCKNKMPDFVRIEAILKPFQKENFEFDFALMREKLNSHNVEFRVHQSAGYVIPERVPSLLAKLEVALANDKLSEEVVKHCLLCLKQEWINKTKILHKFILDKRDKEDTNDMLHSCLNCNDDDVKLMKFWVRSFGKPS